MSKCIICEQETVLFSEEENAHTMRSPIDPEICVGCWVGWIEMEKFLIRATGRVFWTLSVQEAMKTFLEIMKKGK